jgi:hypothetical protein
MNDMRTYSIPSTEVQMISAYAMQTTHVGSTGGDQDLGQAPKRKAF